MVDHQRSSTIVLRWTDLGFGFFDGIHRRSGDAKTRWSGQNDCLHNSSTFIRNFLSLRQVNDAIDRRDERRRCFSLRRLYLLAEGRLGYFGSLEKAPAFFRKWVKDDNVERKAKQRIWFRFGLEIPKNYNPADFYIQQLAIYPKTREENLQQIEVRRKDKFPSVPMSESIFLDDLQWIWEIASARTLHVRNRRSPFDAQRRWK